MEKKYPENNNRSFTVKSPRNAQPSWGELHEAGEEGWGPQLRMLKPGEGKAKSQVCNVVQYQRGECASPTQLGTTDRVRKQASEAGARTVAVSRGQLPREAVLPRGGLSLSALGL